MLNRLASSLAVVALIAGPALADTVKLKNGDVLTGTIVSVLDGKLTLKTVAAGEIKIDFAQVDTFATDAEAKVEVKHAQDPGSDVISSKVAAAGGGNVSVQSSSGAQTLALGSITSVNKPALDESWTGSILGSSTWTRGNTESVQTAIDLNAVRRGLDDRLTFAAWYRASRQEDAATGITSTTQRRSGGSLKYDYFFSKKLYGYAMTSAEKDAIANLDLRFTAGAGVGWQVIEEEFAKFNVEGGVSYFSENYSDATDTVSAAAARAAYHYERKVSDKYDTLFFNDTEAFKVFADAHDFLVHTKAGFRENLTASFFAQEWVEFYWDSTPAIGKKRQDVTYYLGIGWTF